MKRLARIEVQLIMNYLTRIELTLFSRCSRRLLSDGDTDFAWSSQPIYELPNSTVSLNEWLSLTSGTSGTLLIRHQPGFGLCLTPVDATFIGGEITFPSLTRLLASMPRLVRVTFEHVLLSEDDVWWSFVQQIIRSAASHLVECHFSCISHLNLSHLLTPLQHTTKLSALTLPTFYFSEKQDADSAMVLRSLPLLTSLTFPDERLSQQEDEDSTISTSILKCDRLTHLRINYLKLNVIGLHRAFTSSQLSSQLKELTIALWVWVDKEQPACLCAELLRTIWRSMISIERLSFLQVAHMTDLVGTLKSCGPNFTYLEIIPPELFFHPDRRSEFESSDYYPSSASLHELLLSHPQLTIRYQTTAVDIDGTQFDQPLTAHPIYHSLSNETKKRFRFILKD